MYNMQTFVTVNVIRLLRFRAQGSLWRHSFAVVCHLPSVLVGEHSRNKSLLPSSLIAVNHVDDSQPS